MRDLDFESDAPKDSVDGGGRAPPPADQPYDGFSTARPIQRTSFTTPADGAAALGSSVALAQTLVA
jgi:hypothetical protein